MGLSHSYNQNHWAPGRKDLYCGLIAALLFASPVLAADDPTVGLPVGLPSMPADIPAITLSELPMLSLPKISEYMLPSALPELEEARYNIAALYTDLRAELTSELAGSASKIGTARITINEFRNIVGSPLEVTVNNDGQTFTTAYDMAVTMTGAMETSIAYLRGMSSLGATGLSLTFIFLGLAWVMILRLLEAVVALAVGFRTLVMGVIRWIFDVLEIILDVLQLSRLLALFL